MASPQKQPAVALPGNELLIKRRTGNYWFFLSFLILLNVLLCFVTKTPAKVLYAAPLFWQCIAVVVLIVLPLFCLYKIFFFTTIANITPAGIWARNCGLFAWQNIWYVNIFIHDNRDSLTRQWYWMIKPCYLNVRLKEGLTVNNHIEVRIPIPDAGKKHWQVLNLLAVYMSQYNITNLGETSIKHIMAPGAPY